VDVFRLLPSEYLTQNEIDAALMNPLRGVQRAGADAHRVPAATVAHARISISSRATDRFSPIVPAP